MAYWYEQTLPLEQGTRTDPYYMFISRLRENMRLARSISRDPMRTFSYRGCNVAGVLAAATPESGMYKEFDAGNTKARPSKDKRCAELKLMSMRRESGLLQTIGVLVVGPSDNTVIASVLPAARKTLLPCDECAHTLNNDHSMTPETLIVTTGQDNSMYQVRTVKQVGYYYLRPDNDDEAMLTVSSLSYPEALERAELYLSLYAEETHKDAASRRPLAQLAHLSLLAKL